MERMRKLLAILLALVITPACLTACQASQGNGNGDPDMEEQTEYISEVSTSYFEEADEQGEVIQSPILARTTQHQEIQT